MASWAILRARLPNASEPSTQWTVTIPPVCVFHVEPVVEVGDPDLGSELDIGRIVGGDQPPAGDHRGVGEDVTVGRVEPIGQRRRPGRRRVRDHEDRRADRVGARQQELDPSGGLRDGDRLA